LLIKNIFASYLKIPSEEIHDLSHAPYSKTLALALELRIPNHHLAFLQRFQIPMPRMRNWI